MSQGFCTESLVDSQVLEAFMDSVILEQFTQSLPKSIRDWVIKHQLELLVAAVKLKEVHVETDFP